MPSSAPSATSAGRLELAVAGRADTIILRHFSQAGRFGIAVMTPRGFLNRIGESDK